MKNECMIVKDLLPLYIENLISDETRAFVDEHLSDCTDCKKTLEANRTALEKGGDEGAVPLKNVKKNLRQQKLKSVFLAVILAMAILITGFGYLTTPQYVPYSDDLLTLTEKQDGTITVSVNKEKATGFDIDSLGLSEDGEGVILSVNVWKTTWGSLFFESDIRDVVLEQEDGQPIRAIYYAPNNHGEATQIWGNEVVSHLVVLPRLSLVYYLILAMVAAGLGGLLLFFFRKRPKIKIWIERITLLPLAYAISHIMMKDFSTITYSMMRDFVFIMFVAILLYTAALIGLSLYRDKRNIVQL